MLFSYLDILFFYSYPQSELCYLIYLYIVICIVDLLPLFYSYPQSELCYLIYLYIVICIVDLY